MYIEKKKFSRTLISRVSFLNVNKTLDVIAIELCLDSILIIFRKFDVKQNVERKPKKCKKYSRLTDKRSVVTYRMLEVRRE